MFFRHLGLSSSDPADDLPVKRLKALIWLVAAVIISTLGLILIVVLYTDYQTNMDVATRDVENKTTLFHQSVELIIGNMDSLLLSITDRVLNDEFSNEPLQNFLIRVTTTVPEVRVVIVVNPEGIVIADSRLGDTSVGTDVSDRLYYEVHLEQAKRGLFIGPPVQSRFDGAWSFPISRAVRDTKGTLKGIVAASISPRYFEQILSAVATYPSESGSLILEENGIILVTFPHDDALIGQSVTDTPLWASYQDQKQGTIQVAANGTATTQSYRSVAPWPLLVSYRVDNSEALASFWRNVRSSIVLALFLSLIILGIAYYQSNQVQILADQTDALRHLNKQLAEEVDQRREAEEAIRLYEQAVEASGDLVIVVDRDHVYRMVNATYLAYHQRKRVEILGKNLGEVLGEKIYAEQVKPTIERCLEGETISSEMKFHYPHLGERVLLMRNFPLRTEQNKIIGVVTIARDITETVTLEQQYQQAQKIESIGRLAGGIAHDFNNLLVPIIGYVELALMELSPESKLYDDLKIVRKAAERGANLTRQILAFSRKQVLSMEIVDLNEVVETFQKMIQRLIGENIELQTFLSPSLYLINADKGQLEQALMNLVINARDAMPQGGKLTIETSNTFLDENYIKKYADAQPLGHYVMLSVSDTGQGMDAETRKQIFEPFFTTKEAGKGTGLGLATVFGIIKQHRGNIWVYSEVGNGTTFKIYLPRAEQSVRTTAAISPVESSFYGEETVLVVEDEEMVRDLICESLQAHGYRTIEARDAEEALQRVAHHEDTIHLLLTDVIMPGMNGRELQQKVVVVRPNIKTLYMSGYTDNVIVHHGILYQGVNFLQKPFTIHNLLGKVRQTLSHR